MVDIYDDDLMLLAAVLDDEWAATEYDVPELYDTDDYDGWDEEYFG